MRTEYATWIVELANGDYQSWYVPRAWMLGPKDIQAKADGGRVWLKIENHDAVTCADSTTHSQGGYCLYDPESDKYIEWKSPEDFVEYINCKCWSPVSR